LLCILSACAEESSPAPFSEALDEPRQTPRLDLQIGQACAEGTSESCTITLGQHAGVISCYEGTRTCQQGRFSACENGHEFSLNQSTLGAGAADDSSNLRQLSFSSPTSCQNNPCNRYCREFDETPAAGLTAAIDSSAPPVASWSTGSLADYPPDAVAVGLQQPCQVAGDCQFNTACTDPSVGSCSHSVCSTGDPLPDGCNRCTNSVCALNSDCCRQEAECIHDPCDATNAPLDAECDTCVAAVCAVHPECCDTSWNDACVGYIATECAPLGQSCGCPAGGLDANGTCYHLGDEERDWNDAHYTCGLLGTGWNLIQVDNAGDNDAVKAVLADGRVDNAWLGGSANVTDEWSWFASGETFFINDGSGGTLQGSFYENWDIDEPQLGVVGRGVATNRNGEWRDEPIDTKLDFVCKGPPTELGPRQGLYHWGPECVELARSTCGVECPANVPQGLGACIARPPSQLAPGCAGFDLAIGPTCTDGTTQQVPVCNHGQIPAPAGLRLTHLPPSELGKTVPDLTDAIDCTLSVEIPAGRCVPITGCPGLIADRALLINPPDGAQNPSECRFDDNWSVYQPVDCGTPVCEASTRSLVRIAAEECAIPMQNPLGMDPTLARVSVLSAVAEPHCADGEVLWGSSCYHFSSSDIQTWNGARAQCEGRGQGWSLVALNSALENKWVRDHTDLLKDVQIGFTDEGDEGNHAWSNATCQSWVNWDTTTLQPNNSPPGSEGCSRMTASSSERWEDTDCNDSEHPYVCEGPVADAQGGCSAGELAGPDGRCYALDTSLVSAAQAVDVCAARGLGWSRVSIEDENTYAFVTGLLDCRQAWLDQTSPFLLGVGVLSLGEPYLDEQGVWRDSIDGQPRATLCQGPPDLVASLELQQVAGAAECTSDDEYYFDGLVAPENLVLCQDTCTAAARLSGSRLNLEVPCKPPSPPAIETVVDEMYYTADCDGGAAIWDFFYYDAVTPADSRIEFEVRTAPSIAELAAETTAFTPIAQAHAVPTDTQRCEIDPRANCPIDIYTLLGAPAQQYQVLELRVTLVPGTSGESPLLRDWKVRFSCPPSQ